MDPACPGQGISREVDPRPCRRATEDTREEEGGAVKGYTFRYCGREGCGRRCRDPRHRVASYGFRVDVPGTDGYRRQKMRTFPTAGERDRALATLLKELGDGSYRPIEDDKLTVGEYLPRWIDTRRRKNGAPL